jgi:hypothetical protein
MKKVLLNKNNLKITIIRKWDYEQALAAFVLKTVLFSQ